MIPIQDLLNRIRWDKEFGKGHFEIGYDDHIEQKIIRIPFKEMLFKGGNRFSFQLQTAEEEVVTIPLHRIREVYKDGHRIWHRHYEPEVNG